MDESKDTIIRAVIIVPFIILVMLFFAKIITIGEPNQVESLNDFIQLADNAKQNEPFMKNIYIKDYLYGFNSATLSLSNGKTIKKPENPQCNSGSCLCLCKDPECKAREETYCKGVEGVENFLAYGLEENIGKAQNVAFDGNKKKTICIMAQREKNDLALMSCTADPSRKTI
ncbi:hypothetical protein HYU11_01515 [Candidatus Woesearchaeota archaeon]|nr:hypothetical protein [Candidatus Woesearchaeota archaeon]